MFKLLLLMGVVSAALGEETAPPPKVYSFHTRFTEGSLDLSTSELKVFSGHAMNIIRAKCPSVDAQKIFQIQKYMGKLLAKKEPTPIKTKEFKPLLDSMTTCAKEGPIPKTDSEFAGFYPFPGMRTVFIQQLPVKDDSSISAGVDSGLVKDSVHSTEVPTPVAATPRRMIATVIVRPKEMKEGKHSSGGVFKWIHNLFQKVGGFFSNMFSFGHRSKRDISGEDEQTFDATPAGSDEPLQALSPYEVFTPVKDEPEGKLAFGTLIDEWCRIYCDSCSGKKEIRNFKLAAKQLLEDLFEEDSGIEAAAKQYLDNDFLDSIKNCE